MIASLRAEEVAEGLRRVAQKWRAAKEQLTALDAAIGDGDLGITMSRGAEAVLEGLVSPENDVGEILLRAGMIFNDAAPSTMGALLGTAFIAMGRQSRGESQIDLRDIAHMVEAADEAVRARGGAKIGDKTMLDALVPARAALQRAAQAGAGLLAAFSAAGVAAQEGLRSTVRLESSAGRARWLGQRTIGHQDAGATVVYLAFDASVEYLRTLDRSPEVT